jgi:hypothetical protein
VSVTAADPAFGKQGTAGLLVRVLGSGFDQGSRASWERGGAPDPQITVNSTAFVSSSELRANIDIANDADIDLYDVAVYTAGGRKGIGTEKFEVTTATVISDPADYTVARGINDAGLVVGGTGDNAFFDTGERAFLWSPIGGFEVFDQNGGAWAIDQAGTTIVGRVGDSQDGGGKAIIWERVAGSWQRTQLPDLGASATARGLASNPFTGQVSMIVGLVWPPGQQRIPATWTRGTSGWELHALPLPAGPGNGLAQDGNALGMVVGFDGTGCCWALYYDPAGVGQTLPRLNNAASTAWAITEDGLKIVGGSNGRAVIWTRSSATAAWATPTQLEDTRAICGRNGTSVAHDINADGLVVGESCKQPVAWRPSGSTYSRILLGGVGNNCIHGCEVRAVNAGGTAAGRASDFAVYWSGF